jgi:hypothetical protein
MADMSDAARRAIWHDNAIRLYRIDTNQHDKQAEQ